MHQIGIISAVPATCLYMKSTYLHPGLIAGVLQLVWLGCGGGGVSTSFDAPSGVVDAGGLDAIPTDGASSVEGDAANLFDAAADGTAAVVDGGSSSDASSTELDASGSSMDAAATGVDASVVTADAPSLESCSLNQTLENVRSSLINYYDLDGCPVSTHLLLKKVEVIILSSLLKQ